MLKRKYQIYRKIYARNGDICHSYITSFKNLNEKQAIEIAKHYEKTYNCYISIIDTEQKKSIYESIEK